MKNRPNKKTSKNKRDEFRKNNLKQLLRFEYYITKLGLTIEQADIISGREDYSNLFEEAVGLKINEEMVLKTKLIFDELYEDLK